MVRNKKWKEIKDSLCLKKIRTAIVWSEGNLGKNEKTAVNRGEIGKSCCLGINEKRAIVWGKEKTAFVWVE